MSSAQYDVFVSYNSRDRDAVQRVATVLRDHHGLRVWLDSWVLPPGRFWQDHIEEGLQSSSSIAVFVGPGGFGLWEKPEVRVALDRQVKSRTPVIPVLLPGALMRDSGVARIDEVLPPFLTQLTAVVFEGGLDDESAVARLYWGITGRNPLADSVATLPASPPMRAPVTDAGASALNAISDAILAGDVTFLLGRNAAGARPPQELAPSELSARMLRELALIGDAYDGFVPGVEAVASLLAVARGELALERRMVELLTRAGDPQPGVHAGLAGLVKLLGRRPVERRARRRAPPLILTTNFDLLMERALLRAGIPFSRLVQFRGTPRIDVSIFSDVALAAGGEILVGGKSIPAANGDGLDDAVYAAARRTVRLDGAGGNTLVSLAIDQLPGPILYKFQGSQDIEQSCAISADQCFDFAWRLLKQECVPSQITEIIGNSTLIILGTSVFDHDFRLTYHTLLREQLKINTYPRYAITAREDIDRRDPGHQLAQRDWDAVQQSTLGSYGIKGIDAPPAEFLKQLSARIARAWGLGP
jgi:hypothetical protein